MKLILVRHGESEANAKDIFQGQNIDSELSEKGKQQAKKIAERLKNENIEAIYSSGLKRAKQTADELANLQNLKVIFDERLGEFNAGTLNSIKEIGEYFEKQIKEKGCEFFDVKTPNGESKREHVNRIKSFLKDILKKHTGNVILVSSGGTNKLLLGIINHIPLEESYKLEQDNACINIIETNGKNHEIIITNDTSHLK